MTVLADGAWHRLHPASPLLKGGLFLLVIIGWVVTSLKDRVTGLFVTPDEGEAQYHDDAITFIYEHNYLGLALVGLLLVLALVVGGFALSWRMHTFRITDESVEVRSGVIFRSNRKARLDRVQGIQVTRPFVARLVGAAKLEISQAGRDANVHLYYLHSNEADAFRLEILRLASGTKNAASGVMPETAALAPVSGLLDRRVAELLGPDRDIAAVAPASIVTIPPGRLLGSLVLESSAVIVLLAVIAAILAVPIFHNPTIMLVALAVIFAVVSDRVKHFTRSARYSIAGTPDGVRIGFGLLSTSSETLPPGRIHSIEVGQNLLWRGVGWWHLRVNRASHTATGGASNQANSLVLPVGTRDDVDRVLSITLPDTIDVATAAIIRSAIVSPGSDEFTTTPRRARFMRPFSWRRNGFLLLPGLVIFRRGVLLRRLIIVPLSRMQAVSVAQGPLNRILRLATIDLITVAGPIRAHLGAIECTQAIEFFHAVSVHTSTAGQLDDSHRWRTNEQRDSL